MSNLSDNMASRDHAPSAGSALDVPEITERQRQVIEQMVAEKSAPDWGIAGPWTDGSFTICRGGQDPLHLYRDGSVVEFKWAPLPWAKIQPAMPRDDGASSASTTEPAAVQQSGGMHP